MVCGRMIARGKRVAPEEHAAGGFLDDAKRLPGGDLRDDKADRAGTHVENGHQVGAARLGCAIRRHDSFCCPDEVGRNSKRTSDISPIEINTV